MSRSSRLLIQEPPLQVLKSLAVMIGLAEAIVLQQIQYWTYLEKGCVVDGERWLYNSYPAWQESNFPFWTVKVVGNVFRSLEDQGLLKSRQDLNQHKSDRSKWYAINYDKLDELLASDSRDDHDPDLDDGTHDTDSGPSMIPIRDDHDTDSGHSTYTENTSESTTEIASAKADANDSPPQKVPLVEEEKPEPKAKKEERYNGRLPWQVAKLTESFYAAKGVRGKSLTGQMRGQANRVLKELPPDVMPDDVFAFVKYMETDSWWREPGRISPGTVTQRIAEWIAKGKPESVVPKLRKWEQPGAKLGASDMAEMIADLDAKMASEGNVW